MSAAAARSPRLSLAVQYGVSGRGLPSRAQLRRWALAALERDARLTVRIVGGAEGRRLNRCYRGKDYATNVLTFVLHDAPPYEGDLALCAPVVRREARAQRKSATAHYAHLTVHGVLHLQGYDHETAAGARVMQAREARILARLGYPDPYRRRGDTGRARGRTAERRAGA
jgi:probable rRNA maturation factor